MYEAKTATFLLHIGDKMAEGIHRIRADKSEWRSNKPRINRAKMMAVTKAYDTQLAKGKSRGDILAELSKKYERDPRTIERWIAFGREELSRAQAESNITTNLQKEHERKDYTQEAREHDVRIFKESDDILTEANVRYYTNKLQTPDWPFETNIIHKLSKYCWYFSFEGNKYIDAGIGRLCDKWISALNATHDLAATYYFLEGDRLVFMPVGYHHYLNSTDEEQPEYQEIATKLRKLAHKASRAYIHYRKAVKNTLYV